MMTDGINIDIYTVSVNIAHLKSEGVKVDLLKKDLNYTFAKYMKGLFNPAEERFLATVTERQVTLLTAKVTKYPLRLIAVNKVPIHLRLPTSLTLMIRS